MSDLNRAKAIRAAEAALAARDLPAAVARAEAIARAAPEAADGWFLLGLAAAEAGHVSRGLPLVEKAVALDPSPRRLAQLARLLTLARRDADAAEATRRALAGGADDALTLDTLGCVLARLGDHEASVAPFAEAVARAPDNVGYRYNLAAACGFTGRIDAARGHYEHLLAAAPDHARAHYALSILEKQTPVANHLERLEGAAAGARERDDRTRLLYALAKEHEDLGQHEAAWNRLAAANAERRAGLGYDGATDMAIFDALETLFDGDIAPFAGQPGLDDPAPIFVVGMPRTGTTLVDRILSSHPAVASAGELQAMPLAIKQLSGTRSRLVIDAETVAGSAATSPRAIGDLYLSRAAHHRPPDAPRFIDKLPANFLYVGHIAHALPQARIVCLRRNPMDTIWSNFKNLFAPGSSYYFYSNDVMDIARYYVRFDRLMALWQRLFSDRVLELSYEALVADQEGETRRLLTHVGLDWDPACLAFHENRAAVATPSAAQVRRPIYRDAVDRWRVHADRLEPARAWLRSQGIAVD